MQKYCQADLSKATEGSWGDDVEREAGLSDGRRLAMMDVETYRRNVLAKAGKTLYGDRWQTDLARALGLSDGRRIRQWMSGDRTIPAGVWGDIQILLDQRKIEIEEVYSEIVQL